jgi:hypothetical protein
MSEFYKAVYHGFTMEAYRASKPEGGGRWWHSRVQNRDGYLVRDEVLEGHQMRNETLIAWISDEEAKDRALKIVRLEIAKLGEPEPTEPPTWRYSN